MSKLSRNTVKNIRRMPFQALAAVIVLTITFFVGQAFALLVMGSDQILKYFETRPQISAYFNDEATEASILELKGNLEQRIDIASVEYVSKEKALEIYKEQNKDDPLLLEMVTADILPASLEIGVLSVNNLGAIQQELEPMEIVEDVVYQQDVVAALSRWSNGIRTVGLSMVAFLLATSLLIVVIIVGMKVRARRQEVGILQLLGASKRFIIGPFLLEGALYGAVGAVVSWLGVYIVLLYMTPALVNFLGEIPIFPVNMLVMVAVLAGSLVVGTAVGMVGSLIAVRRQLE